MLDTVNEGAAKRQAMVNDFRKQLDESHKAEQAKREQELNASLALEELALMGELPSPKTLFSGVSESPSSQTENSSTRSSPLAIDSNVKAGPEPRKGWLSWLWGGYDTQQQVHAVLSEDASGEGEQQAVGDATAAAEDGDANAAGANGPVVEEDEEAPTEDGAANGHVVEEDEEPGADAAAPNGHVVEEAAEDGANAVDPAVVEEMVAGIDPHATGEEDEKWDGAEQLGCFAFLSPSSRKVPAADEPTWNFIIVCVRFLNKEGGSSSRSKLMRRIKVDKNKHHRLWYCISTQAKEYGVWSERKVASGTRIQLNYESKFVKAFLSAP
mmetsp:Transcript_9904/g.15871  ORF Transcript_9904/g.15871 Transcript_9904/m.15871 type:complete len:326 (+) Transcript_9904:201-1178(+)